MKSLFIILLAGYAVRSDENNYYVIEMQDVPPTPRAPVHAKQTFNVYWNVPTMQCASKKIYFENLYENFGIIQNSKDRFKGENITILYDPGLFPALFKNESNGKFRFRNGGVPQEGDLSKHLDEFKTELDRSIPDKKFSGVAIIDFESWRPQFRQNFGVLQPYKDVSFQIERKLHWWWKEAWIKEEAKRRFEEAARTFLQSTLSVAKKLRPLARWGFYGFPYCFNMASNNLVERCADGVPKENDEISWLWQESTALYPSVYSSVQLSTSQLESLIRGRLREAARCAGGRGDVILPYFWFRYRDSGYLTETDLSSALSMMYKSAATGFIIWGSSNDVNTVDKCNHLKRYVENVLGPAIAKYTKPTMRDNDEYEESTTLGIDTDTKSPTPNLDLILDPEFHWMPPDNYTQDLVNDVEVQISKKIGQNVTNKDNFTVLQNNSVLIDLILNAVLNSIDNTTTTTDNPKTKYDKKSQQENDIIVGTTELNVKISTDTSQLTSSLVTNNPLLNTTNEIMNSKHESEIIERASSKTPVFDESTMNEDNMIESKENDGTNTNLQSKIEIVDFVNNKTTTDTIDTDQTTENDYDETLDDDDDYNFDLLVLIDNKTVVTIEDQTLNTDSTSTDITNNENENQTFTKELLETKDIEMSTEKLIDTSTTDISDILEVQSTDFFESDTFYKDTDGNDYITDTSSDLIYNTTDYDLDKYTIYPSSTISTTEQNDILESSTNHNEQIGTEESNEYQYNNSSILTTTPATLTNTESTNLPNGVTNVERDTEGLDSSDSTESKTSENISTSMSPDTTISTELDDTEFSTSIASATDQVSGASQLKRPYMFCFIFYLYSLSNCLCSIFGWCQ